MPRTADTLQKKLYSPAMESEELKIVTCDVLQRDKVIVSLSDGRIFVLSLDQLLSLRLEPLTTPE